VIESLYGLARAEGSGPGRAPHLLFNGPLARRDVDTGELGRTRHACALIQPVPTPHQALRVGRRRKTDADMDGSCGAPNTALSSRLWAYHTCVNAEVACGSLRTMRKPVGTSREGVYMGFEAYGPRGDEEGVRGRADNDRDADAECETVDDLEEEIDSDAEADGCVEDEDSGAPLEDSGVSIGDEVAVARTLPSSDWAAEAETVTVRDVANLGADDAAAPAAAVPLIPSSARKNPLPSQAMVTIESVPNMTAHEPTARQFRQQGVLGIAVASDGWRGIAVTGLGRLPLLRAPR
jgi:hypothetical protein